jgi:hypothetical protein
MGEWRFSTIILDPRYYMEVSGWLNAPAALPPEEKSPPVLIV